MSVRKKSGPGGAQSSAPAGASATPRRNPLDTVLPALLGVLLVAMLVFSWFLFQKKSDVSQQADARGCFLSAAESMATDMVNMSADNIDEKIQEILDGSTGGHHDRFQQSSEQFALMARDVDVQMTGQVVASAVEDNTETSATVLVVSESAVTNSNTPDARTSYYRMLLTVDKADGVCKTSNIEYVL